MLKINKTAFNKEEENFTATIDMKLEEIRKKYQFNARDHKEVSQTPVKNISPLKTITNSHKQKPNLNINKEWQLKEYKKNNYLKQISKHCQSTTNNEVIQLNYKQAGQKNSLDEINKRIQDILNNFNNGKISTENKSFMKLPKSNLSKPKQNTSPIKYENNFESNIKQKKQVQSRENYSPFNKVKRDYSDLQNKIELVDQIKKKIQKIQAGPENQQLFYAQRKNVISSPNVKQINIYRNQVSNFSPQIDNSIEIKLIQTEKLVKCLKNQIKLDQELRNHKIWFQSQYDPEKWNTLKNCLIKMQKQNDFDKIKQNLKNTQQEHNPFYPKKQFKATIEGTLKKYFEVQQFWVQNIKGKINQKQLENQKFTLSKLDLDKKGYINIQDLVRFMYLETDISYRNRDLILIFKRITTKDRITFQELINVLCT